MTAETNLTLCYLLISSYCYVLVSANMQLKFHNIGQFYGRIFIFIRKVGISFILPKAICLSYS